MKEVSPPFSATAHEKLLTAPSPGAGVVGWIIDDAILARASVCWHFALQPIVMTVLALELCDGPLLGDSHM